MSSYEGRCFPTESSGFSSRPASSEGLMWIQAGSSSGSVTQVNINPQLTQSIPPITINHRIPHQHQRGHCYLSGLPFTVWFVSELPFRHEWPEWIYSHSMWVCVENWSINYQRITQAGMINSFTECVGSWKCLFTFSFSSVRISLSLYFECSVFPFNRCRTMSD